MRVNVYSQELTNEVVHVKKESNTGSVYHAAQIILHSSNHLHHPPLDDDRSAVTFWLPKSVHRRKMMAKAFEEIARIFREAPIEKPVVVGNTGYPDFDDIIDDAESEDKVTA